MRSDRLGKFVASWIPGWPNASGYVLNGAAGSCRVVFSAQVPGVSSIFCCLDKHVSGPWVSFCADLIAQWETFFCLRLDFLL